MKPLKLAVGASISIVLSTWLGQVSVLALPPGAIPAGQYRNVSNEAAFNMFDPSTGSFASLSVFDTVRRAQPQGGPGFRLAGTARRRPERECGSSGLQLTRRPGPADANYRRRRRT